MNNFKQILDRVLNEGKISDAIFKAFYSTSAGEIKGKVKQSSTKFLSSIVKKGGYKGQGGPQKIQYKEAVKELERRKSENEPGPKSGPYEHGF